MRGQAVRVGCSASRRLLCAKVTHKRCALPEEVMACPGVALLGSSKSGSGSGVGSGGSSGGGGGGEEERGIVRRCVTDADEILSALEAHAAHVAAGPALGALQVSLLRAGSSAPMRAVSAFGGSLRSGTIVAASSRVLAPVAHLALQVLVSAQGALVMAAVGLAMLMAGRGLRPRPSRRGRRLGSRRRFF